MTTKNALTPIQQICVGLDKMERNIAESLPKGLSVDKFLRTAKNAIQMHPQKDKLAQADRGTLFNACQKAAIDGLMLDGREAALVVFNTKQGNNWVSSATYMPMTQGLIKMARNSGEISTISSEVVFENDEFEFYEDFDGVKFRFQPNWKSDRGQPILVWAKIKLKDGETIIRALTKERILKIAAGSKNAHQYDPNKGDHYEEWWRKTVIKNALKYAPKSTELETAMKRGEDDEFDYQAKDDVADIVEKQEKSVKRQTKAEQAVMQEETIEHDENGVIDAEFTEEETPVDNDEMPI